MHGTNGSYPTKLMPYKHCDDKMVQRRNVAAMVTVLFQEETWQRRSENSAYVHVIVHRKQWVTIAGQLSIDPVQYSTKPLNTALDVFQLQNILINNTIILRTHPTTGS